MMKKQSALSAMFYTALIVGFLVTLAFVAPALVAPAPGTLGNSNLDPAGAKANADWQNSLNPVSVGQALVSGAVFGAVASWPAGDGDLTGRYIYEPEVSGYGDYAFDSTDGGQGLPGLVPNPDLDGYIPHYLRGG